MEEGYFGGGAETSFARRHSRRVFFPCTAVFDFSKPPSAFTAIIPARAGRMDSDSRDILHALAHTVDDCVVSQTRTVPYRLPSRALTTRGFELGRLYFCEQTNPSPCMWS